jgi:hypothetical protein
MMTATTLTPVTCSTCSKEFRRATSKEDYNRHVTKCAEKVEKRAKRDRVKIRAQTINNEYASNAPPFHAAPSLSSRLIGDAFSQEPRYLQSPAFVLISSKEEKSASQNQGLPPELHVFSLAEVLARQNIIDFNIERVLNKIRVKPTKNKHVYETFGWTQTQFTERPSSIRPNRLILHKIHNSSHNDYQAVRQEVRQRKIMTYLPQDATESEVLAELDRCKISLILYNSFKDSHSTNYVLLVGYHRKLLWRVW